MMRIRKHFPPSSSSFSSLPLSDPQLITHSSLVVVVQPQYPFANNLHQEAKRRTNPDPRRLSSDPPHTTTTTTQPTVIPTEIPALVSSLDNRNSTTSITQQQVEVEHKETIIKDEIWKTEEEMKIGNHIRKESISSAEVDVQFPQSSSSSPPPCQALDKWGEGERIVPPKKRKGSFAKSLGTTSKEMIKPKMNSKTNKKCLQQKGDHDGQDTREKKLATHHHHKEGSTAVVEDTKNTTSSSSTTKKSKRGSVIMEGSRCSRVNGRGWRCCQQTLVGYSLCEHHLGKGRLRSMTSVRNRASAMPRNNITTTATSAPTPPHQQQQEEDDHHQTPQKHDELLVITKSSSTISSTYEDDHHHHNNNININVAPEETPLISMSRKKRKIKKIGSVKARSISSLLGQTDNADASAANRNKNSAG